MDRTNLALSELSDDGDLPIKDLLHLRKLLALLSQHILRLVHAFAHGLRVVRAHRDLRYELFEFGLGSLEARGAGLDRLGELREVLLRLGLADFGLRKAVAGVIDAGLEVRHLGLLAPKLDSANLEDLLLESLDLAVDRAGLLLQLAELLGERGDVLVELRDPLDVAGLGLALRPGGEKRESERTPEEISTEGKTY